MDELLNYAMVGKFMKELLECTDEELKEVGSTMDAKAVAVTKELIRKFSILLED